MNRWKISRTISNVQLLMDTHIFLWLLEGSSHLSKRAKKAFLDPKNTLHFSVVSLWEICIKLSMGKLALSHDWFNILQNEMRTNEIRWLSLIPHHCLHLLQLPFHHRDPFDRLLIAQAMSENLGILTHDDSMRKYAIPTVW